MNVILENIGTIIFFMLVASVIGAVLCKLHKDKKNGRSSCGCNCGCCPNSGLCHADKTGINKNQ